MPRQWTESQKERQRELIRNWNPWKHSTGAITPEGKQRVSRNALKHGRFTAEAKAESKVLQEVLAALKQAATGQVSDEMLKSWDALLARLERFVK